VTARFRRRTAFCIGAFVAAFAAAVAILLLEADTGGLNDVIRRRIEATLHRSVRIGEIRLHLLSRDPTILVRGLVIANPAELHGGNVAEVDSLVAHINLAPLLRGRLSARTLSVSGLRLHLIRFAPGRNNWTFSTHPGTGPAFAPLAPTQNLAIERAQFDIRDYGRALFLSGPFRHAAQGARPFAVHAHGSLGGFPVSLDASGGQLNGAGVGPAWPFHAHLVDAGTSVDAQGVAAQPFDLSRYDLGVRAHGLNLAGLGYLFNFSMPNSAPYQASLRARSDGRHFGFTNLRGVIGASDVAGSIKSDHSGTRRRLIAWFRSNTLARGDVDALLSQVPPRAQARAVSGAVKGVATGRWLLPDAPIGLARLRANDFDFTIAAARTTGYALPLRDLMTRLVVTDGLLHVASFRAGLYDGHLSGEGSLDGRREVPTLTIHGRLSQASVAAIGLQQPSSARLNLVADLAGVGASVHDAAAKSRGTVSVRLTGAVMPRRAAWILGGDLLRALGGTGRKGATAFLPVSCAAADFRASGDGVLNATALGIESPLGTARGSGSIDIGRERLALTVLGQPTRKRLLQLATPVHIAGPLLHPSVSVLPGAGARTLGLRGPLGLALTPVAGLLPIQAKHAAVSFAALAGC
jgi:uncharacterized protein involved in outer membrane biogenesis